MKLRYIFSAVAAVSIMMILILPRMALARPASASAVLSAAVAESTAVVETPVVEVQPPAVEILPTADPEQGGGIAQSVAAVEQPAAGLTVADASASPEVQAAAANIPFTADTTSLESFTAALTNGQAGLLTGVFVEGLFALPVLQQPGSDENFVANVADSLTEYSRSRPYGTVGLLAHNTLSGAEFFHLKQGQEIVLVYGDGQHQRYRITKVEGYQALSPNDPLSNFINLRDAAQSVITHLDVFNQIYAPGSRVVFQTCIEANGNPTWGRLFVIAEPL